MAKEDSGNKSRKDKRKEARLEKNKKKFDSWVQHHKMKKTSNNKKAKNVQKNINIAEEDESMIQDPNKSLEYSESKHVNSEKNVEEKSRTKFEEYMDVETNKDGISADEDLKLERKLAKKLKVKDKKLIGVDNDMDTLFEGISSDVETFDTEGGEEASRKISTSREKNKKSMSSGDDIETNKDGISADEDLKLERKLAKKLKVKDKKLIGVDNDMDTLFEGISSDVESFDTEGGEEASRKISTSRKKNKRSMSSGDDKTKKRKTNFEKYMELETHNNVASAKEDLALERKLAKKLKVKKGKLGGDDDEINMLFEGISSVFDSLEAEENTDVEEEASRKKISRKKRKKNTVQKVDNDINNEDVVEEPRPKSEIAPAKAPVMEVQAKYVPPHLRLMMRNESEEFSQVRKRVRGLLNRLGESNVEGITSEMSTIFQSISRSDGTQIISEEILASCSRGPRGSEQYAAVFASLVSGLACLVGIDFGAKLLASLAKCFEDEYQNEDNLSLRNLTLLLSYLYIFGVCSSDLIYDFMMVLSSRLTEVDVSTILTVLNCSGMRLRSDDPATMKSFIVSIQNKVTELKAASEDSLGNTRSKRMEFMLETIFDIKNNKKKVKQDTLQHTRIKKWLQKLRVESILVRGLKWSKLLDPEKKGQWWLSGDMVSASDNIENVARKIDRESSEAQKMLQLAAGQRMNTDARRAIFCIIMSGEDYIDAFEKLLRLDLQGKQDREIMRVLVECCLQEKVFNKYYCVLASKLCSHDKNHRFTLQYCIWDHYTELESMQLIRSMHLAKLIAEMVSSFTLSLAVLKKADLHDTTQLTSRKIMHFKIFFEVVFEYADNVVWNIFKRIAGSSQYETLRTGIKFFIERYVMGGEKQFAGKYKIAKKALKSIEEEDPFS